MANTANTENATNTIGMARKFYNANETETAFDEVRKERGITEEKESAYVEAIVSVAETTGRFGDKYMVTINPIYLHIPSWQRTLDINRAMDIGRNYNTAKWELPKIILNEGKLYVIEGQHRIFGALKFNKKDIVCELVKTTWEEAISIFLDQSKDRKKPDQYDVYRAKIEANDEKYLLLKSICEENNLNIKKVLTMKNAVGCVTSINDAIRNLDLFEKVTKLIIKLKWSMPGCIGNPFSSKVYRPLKKLYLYNIANGKEGEMEKALMENAFGVEWFNRNIGKYKSISSISYSLAQLLRDAHMNVTIFSEVA